MARATSGRPTRPKSDGSVPLLPKLRFGARANQRKRRAFHDRNIGTAEDLKQPQSVRNLFIAPLISADYRDAQHLDALRLNEQRDRLQVATAGSRAIFVDNHFAPRLAPRWNAYRNEEQNPRPVCNRTATARERKTSQPS